MNKLFKSKFLLGIMIVSAMFVVGVTAKATPAAADGCSITVTLRVGSVGTQVACLQSFLDGGLVADGKFGPKTEAAVKVWQASKGLVADGIFGPKSRAVWMGSASASFPAGCTSSSGYSATTGLPCAGGATLPAGCTSTAGYSPLTGASCASGGGSTLPAGCVYGAAYSSTTGQPCTSTTTPSGTNGYLSDFASDSTNRVSTVYESQTDKVVAGFRATARLADQTVERVRVTFLNADSSSSANLSRYITGASLWYGSNRVATISVNDADRNTSSDLYTFNFSGLNAKVLRDQIGRFYVSVNANGSIDTADNTASWTVSFTDGGVLYSSPDGSSDTLMDNGAITVTGLGFDKFSANGVKATVGLSSANLQATTVKVEDTTVNTNNVELLRFTLKAVESDLTIRKIPVQITSTTENVADIVNSVKLYKGSIADGNVVDTLDGASSFAVAGGGIDIDTADATCTSCGFIFANLSDPNNKITSGSTVTYIVAVDLKGEDGGTNYADDETLTASVVNQDIVSSTVNGAGAAADLDFSVQDSNGDQLSRTGTYRTGSATGNTMTLRTTGAQVTYISSTFVPEDNSNLLDGTISIKFSVKAFGDTDVTIAEAQAAEGAAPANDVIGYTLTGPAFVDGIVTSTDSVANAGIFTVSAGDTRTFTLAVKFNTTSGFTRLTIDSVDTTVITNVVQTPAY